MIFHYKWVKVDEDNYIENIINSLGLGHTHYHYRFIIFGKFVDYSDNDIKLYGSHFFQGLYEYNFYFIFNGISAC